MHQAEKAAVFFEETVGVTIYERPATFKLGDQWLVSSAS